MTDPNLDPPDEQDKADLQKIRDNVKEAEDWYRDNPE